MLQMQGIIVKSRGIFSKNARESQRKWVEFLLFVWETTLLSVVDAAMVSNFYDAREASFPRHDKYITENSVYARV